MLMGINGHQGFENGGDSHSNDAVGPIDVVHQTGGRVANVFSTCRQCGVTCKGSLCDSCEMDFQRGGYPDYFKGQNPKEKFFLDSPFFLNGQSYQQSHSVLGYEHKENSKVYLQGIEIYDGFLVCIVSINRKVPWIHKGRKLGPDGKRDGELTLTPKVSDKYESYRVAVNTENLSEKEMVVYRGVQRNGKLIPDTEINYSSLLQILRKIIEVMKI